MDLADIIREEPDAVKKEKSKKSITIYDILNAMTYENKDLDFTDVGVKKAYDQYMVNRWLSMSEGLVFVAELLNTTHNLTDEQHFDLLKSILPNEKFYFKYIKRKKDVNLKEKRYIAHYFEIGIHDAEEYINHMTQDEIDDILNKYKYGHNQNVIV